MALQPKPRPQGLLKPLYPELLQPSKQSGRGSAHKTGIIGSAVAIGATGREPVVHGAGAVVPMVAAAATGTVAGVGVSASGRAKTPSSGNAQSRRGDADIDISVSTTSSSGSSKQQQLCVGRAGIDISISTTSSSSSGGVTSRGNPANTTAASSGSAGGRRLMWSDDEVAALIEGVAKHGHGRWSSIRNDSMLEHRFAPKRTGVSLKDKWDVLTKTPEGAAETEKRVQEQRQALEEAKKQRRRAKSTGGASGSKAAQRRPAVIEDEDDDEIKEDEDEGVSVGAMRGTSSRPSSTASAAAGSAAKVPHGAAGRRGHGNMAASIATSPQPGDNQRQKQQQRPSQKRQLQQLERMVRAAEARAARSDNEEEGEAELEEEGEDDAYAGYGDYDGGMVADRDYDDDDVAGSHVSGGRNALQADSATAQPLPAAPVFAPPTSLHFRVTVCPPPPIEAAESRISGAGAGAGSGISSSTDVIAIPANSPPSMERQTLLLTLPVMATAEDAAVAIYETIFPSWEGNEEAIAHAVGIRLVWTPSSSSGAAPSKAVATASSSSSSSAAAVAGEEEELAPEFALLQLLRRQSGAYACQSHRPIALRAEVYDRDAEEEEQEEQDGT